MLFTRALFVFSFLTVVAPIDAKTNDDVPDFPLHYRLELKGGHSLIVLVSSQDETHIWVRGDHKAEPQKYIKTRVLGLIPLGRKNLPVWAIRYKDGGAEFVFELRVRQDYYDIVRVGGEEQFVRIEKDDVLRYEKIKPLNKLGQSE